jgi:origin recognition complex subunit 1
MPGKRKRTNVDQARHYLSGGGILREDSDDELGQEDHPWEWITQSTKISGARMGDFECFLGDAVLLKAPTSNEAWVALIYEFLEVNVQDEDGDGTLEKQAKMLWFMSEKEIKTRKKRMDFVQHELYLTCNFDCNPLTTINGKAQIVSHPEFLRRFPNGSVPRTSKAYGKTFVCRRGVNDRTTTYTDEFIWEEKYRGQQDLQSLLTLVEQHTLKTRRSKATRTTQLEDIEEFIEHDDNDEDPATPRKKRKSGSKAVTPSKRKQVSPRKLATPSGRKIIARRPLEFTPLGTRILDVEQTHASPHQIARSTLHVSAVPHALPCREIEFETVQSHLEAAITAGTGACIYISGTPGTGKTATVREVVASLQAAAAEEELDDFYFVEINGMKVTDPHQSYSLLWEALKGDRVSPSHALELLEREFTTPGPRRVPCVVLMDELDQLVTRNQGVMYNFFNWPQLRHSRLIVLAVANTMDLPERTLSNKISSRLGLTRITFPGYTHTQLMAIIQSRLTGVDQVIVEPDAIQFASRKVAAVSGDARRALDICRRAVEIAEQDVADQEGQRPGDGDGTPFLSTRGPGKENLAPDFPSKNPSHSKSSLQLDFPIREPPRGLVTIATIKRAINEATSTPLAAHLRSLPLASKLFLAALLARLRRTGITESTLSDVVDEARKLGLMAMNPFVEEFLLTPVDIGYSIAKEQAEKALAHAQAGVTNTPSRRGGRPPAKKEVVRVARALGLSVAARELVEAGVIGVEMRSGERAGRVRLGVGEDEIRAALRDDEECRGLGLNG